ncbi:hypothetical protein CL655_00630 [bacterium]|nr:hypothetical protein [bacterium]|tara:strand:+ start:694 stop:1308 length:615 start_codon:yes stop_codon:yes gene_type:complete
MRKRVWTDDKLKAGFDAFIAEHGRLPSSHEVDTYHLLPTARSIQKRCGGLVALRERLGYTDTHLGTGAHRSAIAYEVGIRGRQLEIELEVQLQERFGERSVHTEKIFNGKQRVDFYVYTKSGVFGADIFFPATTRTMQNNINIKMKKYQHFTEPLYLVVANPEITQTQLDTYTQNRKEPFSENISLLTQENFMTEIENYEAYGD